MVTDLLDRGSQSPDEGCLNLNRWEDQNSDRECWLYSFRSCYTLSVNLGDIFSINPLKAGLFKDISSRLSPVSSCGNTIHLFVSCK